MSSERFTASCSYFDLSLRSYFDEVERQTKSHTFVVCRRDGERCVPGKFPNQCPDGRGEKIDLVVVGAGQIFEELGQVTVLTRRY